ncbi:MAG: hypothetical protein CL844_00865 [Crocinitomicaceae bacterium]|nr:hypothetical protein [Crocinitomicaceae bacterium]
MNKLIFKDNFLFTNITLIVVNLIGLVFLVLGFHDNFEQNSIIFRVLGFGFLLLSSFGIVFYNGKNYMSDVSRVLVGGLFIVSGLVKANDPIGFSYKLEEYFEDGALAYRIKEWFSLPSFSLEFLIDYALFFSIVICIIEIILGVLTIIGGKMKLVSYLMLLMMFFFTFLTWHTANCNSNEKFKDRDTYLISDPIAKTKMDQAQYDSEINVFQDSDVLVIEEMKNPQCVDDCGCFGDAMKGSVGRSLTPKESLWKDLVLLYLIIWIFASQSSTKPNNKKQNILFISASMLVIVFFSWVFGWYFPVFFSIISILGALSILRYGGKYLGNHYGSILVLFLLSSTLVWYVYSYSPIKDYRPYAVGSNLIEKMNDGVAGIYENILVYKNKKNNKEKEYSDTSKEYFDSKIWENKDWELKTQVKKVILPTKTPSITEQFDPFISREDIGEYEMNLDIVKSKISDSMLTHISIRDYITDVSKIVLISSKSLDEGNWQNINRIKDIQKICRDKDVPCIMMCGESRESVNMFREKYDLELPVFINDGTELKTISRSNPSVLFIENAVVKAKYSARSIPTREEFLTKYFK